VTPGRIPAQIPALEHQRDVEVARHPPLALAADAARRGQPHDVVGRARAGVPVVLGDDRGMVEAVIPAELEVPDQRRVRVHPGLMRLFPEVRQRQRPRGPFERAQPIPCEARGVLSPLDLGGRPLDEVDQLKPRRRAVALASQTPADDVLEDGEPRIHRDRSRELDGYPAGRAVGRPHLAPGPLVCARGAGVCQHRPQRQFGQHRSVQ
jgi:hypothetical protein